MFDFKIDLEEEIQEKQYSALKKELVLYLDNVYKMYLNGTYRMYKGNEYIPQMGSFGIFLDAPALERIAVLTFLLQNNMIESYNIIINILLAYMKDSYNLPLSLKNELVALISKYAIK